MHLDEVDISPCRVRRRDLLCEEIVQVSESGTSLRLFKENAPHLHVVARFKCGEFVDLIISVRVEMLLTTARLLKRAGVVGCCKKGGKRPSSIPSHHRIGVCRDAKNVKSLKRQPWVVRGTYRFRKMNWITRTTINAHGHDAMDGRRRREWSIARLGSRIILARLWLLDSAARKLTQVSHERHGNPAVSDNLQVGKVAQCYI